MFSSPPSVLPKEAAGSKAGLAWLPWVVLLAVTFACYAPGLHGGFVFDDDVNILGNDRLRISSLNWRELWAAAWSGDAGPLGRPVALLTFALNLYFGGGGPYAFKLVNVLIHLANVLLIGATAQALYDAFVQRRWPKTTTSTIDKWAGWMVAALWALHPINLTSVLYVVQRMTSLSALFGLVGLLIFVRFRAMTWQRQDVSHPVWKAVLAGFSIAVLVLLSALTKESGLLFAPLLLWIEYSIFGFMYRGRPLHLLSFDLQRFTTMLVCVGAIYIAVFKLPAMLGPGAFNNRDFTLTERALTESRVLFYYLRMVVLPRNAELSLYHDDFEVSSSLWSPVSTALSVAGLAVICISAWLFRRKAPELWFALGWFLIAHAMESTIFPLELVHEHRNYFATFGLFLLVPLYLRRITKPEVRRLCVALFCAYLALLCFVTGVRALQWSNHVDWAALEAANHPASPRATYELARVYMALLDSTGEARFGELADEALLQAANGYLPGVLPYLARIHLAYFRNLDPAPSVFEKAKYAFEHWPYRNINTAALRSFVTCQIDGKCRLPDAQALELLEAALRNPRISNRDRGEVNKLLAQYYINKYNDLPKGTLLIHKAIDADDSAASRLMYAQALAMQGQFGDALGQLDEAEKLDRKHVHGRQIDEERKSIRQVAANQ
ncbi:tetratricopeptide repeat protein [Variovorax ginsengisoli]|uniref:Tetratricopeptide repeat protein n=1 Tax=Variovorax ginsengisoli TaxID=363844 RepID=A0ABT8RX94_9BURK|nr:hypothetical protein [Variovorax ginsengisoli]MDN8612096.1 hypothetical protein [Variovorax ginsengisoli]MDO1531266.1 hypothetical protein [Variovorax ginsengisoli]